MGVHTTKSRATDKLSEGHVMISVRFGLLMDLLWAENSGRGFNRTEREAEEKMSLKNLVGTCNIYILGRRGWNMATHGSVGGRRLEVGGVEELTLIIQVGRKLAFNFARANCTSRVSAR